jgi:hypothetical protein
MAFLYFCFWQTYHGSLSVNSKNSASTCIEVCEWLLWVLWSSLNCCDICVPLRLRTWSSLLNRPEIWGIPTSRAFHFPRDNSATSELFQEFGHTWPHMEVCEIPSFPQPFPVARPTMTCMCPQYPGYITNSGMARLSSAFALLFERDGDICIALSYLHF